MGKLPVLLSIPHGGTVIPPEVKGRVILSKEDLFDDGDAFTKEVYDLKEEVVEVISADIARAFVDMNRAFDDLPPENPDGVIKSHTCYGKIIYRKGLEPDKTLIKLLLDKYYIPYHQKIQNILDDKNLSIKLTLDCHSMASVGPAMSSDKGEPRPLICLGNADGKSCSQEIIEKLADCFLKAFSLKSNEISINRPFSGGYITRFYGSLSKPWIQVELNRSLYLRAPFFDPGTLLINRFRLQELQNQFRETLRLLFSW